MIGLITNWIFGERDVSTSIVNKLGIAAIFTALTGFVTWLTDLIVSGMDKITNGINAVVNSQWPQLDLSQIAAVGSIANSIFPLTEGFTIFASLYVFAGVVFVIRWIKSFVPTLAN